MHKKLEEIVLPNDRHYTDEHIWIKKDGDSYLSGISDFAQDQLGEVMFVDVPSVGDKFKAGVPYGEVESIKSVNKLFTPGR
jgi:glycine cleavage system H protein